jgi:hypothetical protein
MGLLAELTSVEKTTAFHDLSQPARQTDKKEEEEEYARPEGELGRRKADRSSS